MHSMNVGMDIVMQIIAEGIAERGKIKE